MTAAQRSLDLSVIRYKGGVTSYLEVITAQSAALSDEVTAVNILRPTDGEHSVANSGPRRRMGPLKLARTARMLRQAGEQ